MRVVFVRHGKRQAKRRDPELTPAGRSMARETGEWLVKQGYSPTLICTTDTNRTRQTAEAIRSVLPHPVPVEVRALPELVRGWQKLVNDLTNDVGESTVVMVGHHPTTDMLLATVPMDVPSARIPKPVLVRGRYASALVLNGPPWLIVDVWPGRP